ncbi:unnamed protein product [Phytomonas sp. EM1]|nr:unnamed protein product [Phytomonas sp. EM1]|eukprot:CCW63865.1 unnamed protein product [Phytomonas sp. isolate EM1]
MTTLSPARVAGLASRCLTNELQGLARAGDWEGALAAFRRIEPSTAIRENVFHYTTVLHACGRAGRLREAFEVFDQMKARRVRPNVFTYTVLIDACGRAGKVEEAFCLFAEMRLRGEAPNVKTLTALAAACARVGRWEKAMAVLRAAEGFAIAPNVLTYTAVMEGCRRAGVCAPALALLARMRDPQNVRPNPVTYNTALGACVAAKDAHAARRVYARMVADGYKPLPYTRDLLGELFKGTEMEGWVREMAIQPKAGRYEAPTADPAPDPTIAASEEDKKES